MFHLGKNKKFIIFFICFFLISFIFFYIFNKIILEKKIKQKKIINERQLIEKNSKKIVKIIAQKKENIYKKYNFFKQKVDEIIYEKKILNGFFISSDGKIITNKHILCKNCNYFAFYNNKKYNLEIEKIFKNKDLIIFKIISKNKKFSYIKKFSKNKEIGKKIFLLNYNKKILTGKVFKKIPKLEFIDNFGEKNIFYNLLETNLNTKFGDSGSPIFNEFGELIGINSFLKNNKNYIIDLRKN